MTTRHRSLNRRARRLNESDGPIFLTVEGNPEAVRLRCLYSNREALIGGDHFAALDGETTDDFHDRLRRVAKERGCKIIELGHSSNRALAEAFWAKAAPAPERVPEGATIN
jgi:hypothetical protein